MTKTPMTKTILNGVSANMPASSLTAIVGGSGSGKVRLLGFWPRSASCGPVVLRRTMIVDVSANAFVVLDFHAQRHGRPNAWPSTPSVRCNDV
jgi:ABC-type enterochelin transport system ATPase subunit